MVLRGFDINVCLCMVLYVGWIGFSRWTSILHSVNTHEPMVGCQDWQTEHSNDDPERPKSQGTVDPHISEHLELLEYMEELNVTFLVRSSGLVVVRVLAFEPEVSGVLILIACVVHNAFACIAAGVVHIPLTILLHCSLKSSQSILQLFLILLVILPVAYFERMAYYSTVLTFIDPVKSALSVITFSCQLLVIYAMSMSL